MLPPQLSNDVCSLKEGRDRRAVTVEVTFDAELRPGEPRFLRSLIRSDARLDYTEAHEILEGARSSRSASVVETLRLADACRPSSGAGVSPEARSRSSRSSSFRALRRSCHGGSVAMPSPARTR